ncbi:MAG: cupin domain-containing protein [Mariprofundaceae bacterium]|nr:cupin domain-containing protein [Mariprofundaceae bacterium]
MKNLFNALPSELQEELIEVIAGNGSTRIERIVSHGHCSKKEFWYDQDEDEFVLLLEGEAELEFEDETIHLKKGDYLTIKAYQRHRVKWTTPDKATIWLAVFYAS